MECDNWSPHLLLLSVLKQKDTLHAALPCVGDMYITADTLCTETTLRSNIITVPMSQRFLYCITITV